MTEWLANFAELEKRISNLEQLFDTGKLALTSQQARVAHLEKEIVVLRQLCESQGNVNQKLKVALDGANSAAATQGKALHQLHDLLKTSFSTMDGMIQDITQIREHLGLSPFVSESLK